MQDPSGKTKALLATSAGRGVAGLALILVWPFAGIAISIAVTFLRLPLLIAALGGSLLPVGMVLVRAAPPPKPARGCMAAAIVMAAASVVLSVVATPFDLGDPPPRPEEVQDGTGPPADAEEVDVGREPLRSLQTLLLGAATATFAWGMRRWLLPAGEQTSARWWSIYAAVAAVYAVMQTVLSSLGFPAALDRLPPVQAGALVLLNVVVVLASVLAHVRACTTGIGAVRRLW